jgi:general secretion pathway protein H
MPRSAHGSEPRPTGSMLSHLRLIRTRRHASHGFTLLELLVVVAMIAITVSIASFALPDPSNTRLEREAARLVAMLESARMQARSGALTVMWVPQARGDEADYQFLGLPPVLMPPLRWLTPEIRAEIVGAKSIVLGPEPVIGAQSLLLILEGRQLVIGTDGLGAFQVIQPSGEDAVDAPQAALR